MDQVTVVRIVERWGCQEGVRGEGGQVIKLSKLSGYQVIRLLGGWSYLNQLDNSERSGDPDLLGTTTMTTASRSEADNSTT